MELSFEEIVNATNPVIIRQNENSKKLFEFSTDSRTIKKNQCYIALKGEKFDGHDFLKSVADKGGVACIVSDKTKICGNFDFILLVENTKIAYLQLARYYKRKMNVKTIAITGSNGKTTTKEMMYAVCSHVYETKKTELNHNNEIGLCLTLSSLTPTDKILIVEMGMRGLGEIELLSRFAEPDIALIVNVTETHIGRLGSFENIAKAKCEISSHLNKNGTLIALDMPLIKKTNTFEGETIYFSPEKKTLKILTQNKNYSKFEYKGQIYEINIGGEYNIQNAMAVIEAALKLQITPEKIAEGLKNFKQIEKRWEENELNGYHIINDSYNASPASVRASFKTFLTCVESPKVIIFGDMGELGQDEIRYHKEVGEYVDNFDCDMFLTLGNLAENANPKTITTKHFYTKEKLVSFILSNVKKGTNILLKASRSMKFEEIIKELEQK